MTSAPWDSGQVERPGHRVLDFHRARTFDGYLSLAAVSAERLEAILALEEKIEHLVHRIPDDFLPIDQKHVITGGLVGRREGVARLFRRGGRP